MSILRKALFYRRLVFFIFALAVFFTTDLGLIHLRAQELEGNINIEYRYVTQDEAINEADMIVRELPKMSTKKGDIYYLVYEPIKEMLGRIPKTSDNSNISLYLLAFLISAFIVWILLFKGRKKKIAGILVVSILITSIMGKQAIALTNEKLAAYNQRFILEPGHELLKPLDIEGYRYIGYINQDSITTGRENTTKAIDNNIYTKNSKTAYLSSSSGNNYHSEFSTPSEAINNNRVILVKTIEKEVSIPYRNLDTVYTEDDTLEIGKTRKVPGKDGKEIIEYEVIFINGIEISYTEKSRKIVPAIPTTIYIGVKDEDVIDDTDVVSEPSQPTETGNTGNTEEPTETGNTGNTGEPTETGNTGSTGEPTETGNTGNTGEPTAPEREIRRRIEEVVISYSTREIDDNTLDEGQIITEGGIDGAEEIEYEDIYENGSRISSRIVSRTVLREAVDKVIRKGTKPAIKAKPVVSINSILKDSYAKKITVDYNLTDNDNAYVSAVARVYYRGDDENIVAEVNIENLSTEEIDERLEISGLETNTPYTLKTFLTYNNGNSEQSVTEESTMDFVLEFKKIELKYINSVKLYDNNNQVISLESTPTDLSNYYVKITSDKMKDVILPVSSIAEEEVDGEIQYKVGVHTSELTHDKGDKYADDYYFYIEKANPASGVYTSFEELVNAIRQNPSGTFVLGANISAASYNLPEGALSYIPEEFTGTLTGINGDKKYGIYGLKVPLFERINGAIVREIDFKDTDIFVANTNIATLAREANNSTIENVAVTGDIKANKNLAGIVYKTTGSTFLNNVSFKGNITSTENVKGNNEEALNVIGGIVSEMMNNSKLEKAIADVNINAVATSPYHKIGSAVGRAQGPASLKDIFAKGNIINSGNSNVQIGGIIGSTWKNGIVRNVVSGVNVVNGRKIHGDTGYSAARITEAFYIDTIATGTDDNLNNRPTAITEEEAKTKLEQMGITATAMDSDFDNKIGVTDYTDIQGYDPNKKNVYSNIEKLIPFYNKELIVQYGNKVDINSNFYNKEILNTVLMKDALPLHNLAENKALANKLLIYYKDSSTEILDLSYISSFKDTEIEEYSISDTGLIYTPEIFSHDYSQDINALLAEMQNLDYMSTVNSIYPNYTYLWGIVSAKVLAKGGQDVRNEALRNAAIEEMKNDGVDPYALKEAFAKVKENLREHIIALLETDNILDKTGRIDPKNNIEYIRANKEKILFGLAYLERWYNVNVGDSNIKAFTMYHQDLFGEDINHAQALVRIADMGDDRLKAEKTAQVYKSIIGSLNGKQSLQEYLEAYKNIFDKDSTMPEWFKNSTKAEIFEAEATMPELSDLDTSVWYNLSRSNIGENFILPILTMEHKGLGIVSTTSTVTFSPFERYHTIPYDETFDDKEEMIQAMRKRMEEYAKQQTLFFEFWYRMANENVKQKLFNNNNIPMFVYDGYKANGGWLLPLTAEETSINNNGLKPATHTIKDFFAPLGKWYRFLGGTGAYADGTQIFFVINVALDKNGSSVNTHEVTHNLDNAIFLGGYGRREGTGAEDYALGMLQSIVNGDTDIARGINVDTDYNVYANGSKLARRLHNATPERFRTQEDLKEFYQRSYELNYLMSYAEAEAMMDLPKEDIRVLLNKIEMQADGAHYKDSVRAFTDDEWNTISFTSINDFIDNNMVVLRRGETVGRNTYAVENMFQTNFGAYTTPNGAPGSRTFKQTSFEMLGAAGYEGFLNYTSNKLKNQAQAEGETFSDAYIIKKTFNGRYESFNDFRKDMYANVYAKKAQLKPFTYNGNTYNTYEDLKNLMREKVAADIVSIKAKMAANQGYDINNIKNLKADIYRYYINSTDDFRQSIFNE